MEWTVHNVSICNRNTDGWKDENIANEVPVKRIRETYNVELPN